MFYKDSFLLDRKRQWLRSISKVQLYAGGSWYDAVIQTKDIIDGEITIIAVCSALDNVATKITSSRLIDTTGNVAAEQAENISKVSGQGAMIKLILPIVEG